MYKLYDEYKCSLKLARKGLRKRQKLNAEIREKYEEPHSRSDHNQNKTDITHWNSMVSELKEVMKMIEIYLEFEDRDLLHKEYNRMKKLILNLTSYEGDIPLETAYGEIMPDTTMGIYEIEKKEELMELLDEVLTERQKEMIYSYFWMGMTQEEIAEKLNIDRATVTQTVQNSLEKLRNHIKKDDFADF